MKIKPNRAFTMVELMIIVFVISVIIAIALPNFVRIRETSHRNTCIANLRKIVDAIDTWILVNTVPTGTVISSDQEEEIYSGYLKGPRPKCPAGGTYTMHAAGSAEEVTCSLSDKGHTLATAN